MYPAWQRELDIANASTTTLQLKHMAQGRGCVCFSQVDPIHGVSYGEEAAMGGRWSNRLASQAPGLDNSCGLCPATLPAPATRQSLFSWQPYPGAAKAPATLYSHSEYNDRVGACHLRSAFLSTKLSYPRYTETKVSVTFSRLSKYPARGTTRSDR